MITPHITQPFLITTRFFPTDGERLSPILNKAYIETAQAVNARVIGSFEPVEVITGERWFEDSIQGEQIVRRQSYRKFFRFGAIAAGATLNIVHDILELDEFTTIYGTCETDTPDFRPINYASATLVTDQIELNVTNTAVLTNINIINGATAPNIVRGIVVVEYLKI